jgi:FlaA1/EpsC-like NDP-sugar epimerase
MPKIVIEKGKVSVSDLRKIEVADLLGRDLTPIDVDEVKSSIEGKRVVVTGAAGSIGSELCRQLIKMKPEKIHLFEIDESRLYELWLELEAQCPGCSQMHIVDIRDRKKLEARMGMVKPEVVLHSAAYKHVPLMEAEQLEAIRSNVLATHSVMELAQVNGCERFVLISTDKAVAPSSVMGKTKELAERLILDFAENRDSSSTESRMDCITVRFGNVLGSRGSVVPIFEEKLARNEPLSVTDPEVTRYFMTIPEAARLVLQAQAIGQSGDIFLLEMGDPVKIVDLARKMIALSGAPADIEFVGMRPGEKMHEVLISDDEELRPTERQKILKVVSGKDRPMDALTLEKLKAAVEEERPFDKEDFLKL